MKIWSGCIETNGYLVQFTGFQLFDYPCIQKDSICLDDNANVLLLKEIKQLVYFFIKQWFSTRKFYTLKTQFLGFNNRLLERIDGDAIPLRI